jgi:hypothetical protein
MPSSSKKKSTKKSTTVKRRKINPTDVGKKKYRNTKTPYRRKIRYLKRFPKSKPLTSKNLQAHLLLLADENANKVNQANQAKKIKPNN